MQPFLTIRKTRRRLRAGLRLAKACIQSCNSLCMEPFDAVWRTLDPAIFVPGTAEAFRDQLAVAFEERHRLLQHAAFICTEHTGRCRHCGPEDMVYMFCYALADGTPVPVATLGVHFWFDRDRRLASIAICYAWQDYF